MSAKILIVTPDIIGPVKNGGIGTACFHYARTLSKAGISVDILFTLEVSARENQYWKSWYDGLSLGFKSMSDVPELEKHTRGCAWYTERSLRIRNYLLDKDYKYIIFQDWQGNGFWTARSKQMGVGFSNSRIGLITHSPNQWQRQGMEHHGDEPFERADLEWVEREAIEAADIIISPSQHMLNWLMTHGYKLPEATACCPITFEDEIFHSQAATFDPDHLIFFGRLETRKGLHLLTHALVRIREMACPLPKRLSLLGKKAIIEEMQADDYLEQMKRELPEIDMQVRDDLSYAEAIDYIRAQNGLVVIPSLMDNFPLTVVESVANGFFFIASDVGGIPEIVDPAVTFRADASSLAEKLITRRELAWDALRHPYNPAQARETWLRHVEGVLLSSGVSGQPAAPAVSRNVLAPVSICVPFYCHDAHLRRMATAFLRAPEPEIQLVIVNDGTPADEAKEFHNLSQFLSPLGHVFHTQPNSGPGAARNQAVRLAAHEQLLFFDADNVPFPNMVKRMLNAMQAADADSISAPFAAVPLLMRQPVPADVWFHFIPPGGSAVRALIENILGDATLMLRRETFEGVGGFNLERASWEDWEFILALVLRDYRHMVFPEPLLFYSSNAEGRNNAARRYYNRCSLLDSLRHAPPGRIAEMLHVFIRDHLKRIDFV